MRIRRLELHGFKSFPDRTDFVFGRGISGIVGPNGCGKSNVVDAVKWVIGESSAKALRGSEMTDILFAGSATRSPVGFAEVALTFAADDGEPFPGELAHLAEVQISRRIDKTGSGEYRINQTRCRKRDITDFLLDTGVSNDLYAFIEQGRIDKMIRARPEERRLLIDEAAGISRYKVRRTEALGRLESTATQLDRVADVEEEMVRRLRVLEKQVLTAARFRQLRARVRLAEIGLAVIKVAALVDDRRAISRQRRTANQRVTELEREWERQGKGLGIRQEELGTVENAVERWRDELAELEARRRELEGSAGFARRRIAEGEQEAQRGTDEERTATTSRDEAQVLHEAVAAEQLAATEAVSLAEQTASRARETLDGALAETRKARATVDRNKEVVNRTTERVLGLRAKLDGLADRFERLPERQRQLQERLEALERARLEAVADEEKAVAELEALALRRAEATGLTQARQEERQQADQSWQRTREAEAAATQRAKRLEADRTAQLEQAERGLARLAEQHRQEHRERSRTLEAQRRDAARVRARAQAARDQAHREAEQAARARSERWRRERSAQLTRLGEALRTRQQRRRSELDGSQRAEQQTLTATLAEERTALEVQLDATWNPREQAAEQALTAAGTALEQARRAEGDAREAVERAQESLAACRARNAAARAALEAMETSDALAGAPALADRIDLRAYESDWLASVLGEGLTRPVLTDPAQVLALRDSLSDEQQAVVWLAPGEPEQVLARRQASHGVVASLEEALERFSQGQGASVVVPGGERIDADGTVWLGVAAGSQRRLDAERQLDEAALALTEAEQALALAREQRELAQRQRGEAESVEREARKALEGLRRQSSQARKSELEAFRVAADRRESALRATHREARTQLEGSLDALADAARQEIETTQRQEQRLVDEALSAWREQAQAVEQGLRREAAEEARAEQDAHDAELATLELAHRQDLELARARVSTVRDAVQRHRAGASGKVDEARTAQEKARAALDQARDKVREAEHAQGRLDLEARQLETRKQAAVSEQGRRKQDQERLLGDLANLDAESAEVQTQRAALKAQLEAALLEDSEARQELAFATEVLQLAELEQEAANEVRTKAEVGLAEAREQVRTLAARSAAALERRQAAEEAIERAQVLIADSEDKVRVAREELATIDADLHQLSQEREQVQARHDEEKTRLAKLRTALEEARTSLTELQEELSMQRVESERLEARLEGLKDELERTRGVVETRYQISVDGLIDRLDARGEVSIEPDPSVASPIEVAGKRIEGVPPLMLGRSHLADEDWVDHTLTQLDVDRQALGRIGEVNLHAVEEYTELVSRHKDIATQREDLEESMGRIRTAIAKINRTCRERFRDAFDRVDAHFRVLYPRLVGGGQASLGLTNEDDLLETGVDIFVQPPGKRLQNLTLLSGGEKAMTAIALMLSLFKVKPSPFCMLDEVDAPLDEGNGSRFNELLAEMSSTSQFIVVTHNKKTMEVADTLYGVTMPVPGVSRLVTVSLD